MLKTAHIANDSPNNPLLIAVEGNIGAGKSTALSELERRGYTVVREPIDQWSETLTLFYTNPKQYSFLLQARIMAELVQSKEAVLSRSDATHKGNVVFFERSQKGARVFVEVSKANGDMNAIEYETYFRLEETVLETRPHLQRNQVHVLVDTPPLVCCERTVERNRSAEQSGPLMRTDSRKLRYLRKLHDMHEVVFPCSSVVRVDGCKTPSDVADDILSSLYKQGSL